MCDNFGKEEVVTCVSISFIILLNPFWNNVKILANPLKKHTIALYMLSEVILLSQKAATINVQLYSTVQPYYDSFNYLLVMTCLCDLS